MKYAVYWDNDIDCGTFSGRFTSEKEAERWARNWKREMVAIEPTERERREARRVYQWEVIEIEEEELDPEGAPDNPRPEWA